MLHSTSKISYIHTAEIHNTNSAEEVLPYIFNLIKPASVIDIGCGTGSWLKIAKQLGVKLIQGVDGIYLDRQLLSIENEEFKHHDLTLPLQSNIKYDLAICLEVAEHLPEASADNLVDILTEHSAIVLFSAAVPGQGGQFHINEQWPDYWQNKFASRGYFAFDTLRDIFWNNEKVEWWYRQNMFIFSNLDLEQMLASKKESKPIRAHIHPDLFKKKVKDDLENRQFIKNRISNPQFTPTLRLLIKSIVKRKNNS